jgi:hypothetical protein
MKTSLAYVSVFLLFACAPEKPDELAGNEQIYPSSGEASSPANDDYQGSKNRLKRASAPTRLAEVSSNRSAKPCCASG